jgi:hypothetical protein
VSAADTAKKIVQDMTGMWWPDADEGGLRDAAKAWRDFADDLEEVTAAANKSARGIIEHNKGEAISAFDDPFWRRYYYDGHGWLQDMINGARDMAKALDQYADVVRKAVKHLEHELEIVAGTALAIFTLGISEGAAAAATASILELSATLGVTVSTEIATIAGTTLATAAIGGLESITVDLAVTQPAAMATGGEQGPDPRRGERLRPLRHGVRRRVRSRRQHSPSRHRERRDGGPVQRLPAEQRGPRRDGHVPCLEADPGPGLEDPRSAAEGRGLRAVSGDPVYFGRTSTTVGYDERTLNNLQRVARIPGVHDVVVHGTDQGVFVPGRVNAAGKTLTDFEVHPNHIADAIRSNPNYHGEPVRLISCYSGADARPPELPLAQSVANKLGVPVTAPTSKVGTSPDLGLNQTPTIGNNGYWRTYLPMAH